ncbi:MAG TPA: thiamine-phosphate kinase [Candidatus Paceibacterota bacterium]|nr:thiamine-phosphate kinase [Verrucomicrobiota bacterium]HRZ46924.1 thiamine-phosphate kinase [Candidatus Paceibacterota bacterium]HRZ92483.1 thiamine-phosphate kinase [Candidatus Paceibacterota bacterium]
MNEFALIQQLTRSAPANSTVVLGPGDDCAVLDLGLPDRWVLFKTDAVVEGVHFLRATPPPAVGHKALGRCLSDMAAMGGAPSSAVITVALPPDLPESWALGLYEGIRRLAERFGLAIVGGETSSSPGGIFVSVAMLGTVAPGRCARRTGSQPGDSLWVTGELGGSIEGHHLDFEPRVGEALWLTEHFMPRAMIDLSDGLAGDLRHLVGAEGRGAELLAEAIPVSRAARRRARDTAGAPAPLAAALADGEDFELLFAQPPRRAVALIDAWKKRFPTTRLSCIGRITAEPGLRLRRRGKIEPLVLHGYEHFA